MNKILTLVILAFSLLEATSYPDPENYYPDENGTIVNYDSMKIKTEGAKVYSTVKESNLSITIDDNGDKKYNQEMNSSSLIENIRNLSPKTSPGVGVVNLFKKSESYVDFDYANPAGLTQENVLQQDGNSSLNQGINQFNIIKAAMEAAHKKPSEFLNCYITRELVPAYFCPISGKDGVFYGGDAKTSKVSAMEKCADECINNYECVAKENGFPSLTEDKTKHSLLAGTTIELKVNDKIQLEKILIDFKVDFDKQENNEDQDDNRTLQDVIGNASIYVKYDVTATDYLGNEEKIYQQKNLKILSKEQRFKMYLTGVYKKVEIKFYIPRKLIKESYVEPFSDEKLIEGISDIYIEKSSIDYGETDYYFCPNLQYITSAEQCKSGVVKTFVDKTGTPRSVCFTKHGANQGQERELGAYYKRTTCESKCAVPVVCKPTYANSYNPEANYRVNVGCVDTEENVGCTKQRCMEFMENPSTIVEEINYANDDTKEYTVLAGQRTQNERPRVAFNEEMEGNDRDNTFISSMKDIAYHYMINNSRFTTLKNNIEQPTQILRTVSETPKSEGGNDYTMSLKPSSIDYDGAPRYLYSIVKFEQSYTPIAGSTYSTGSDITAKNKPLLKDISYISFDGTLGGYEVFKRDLDVEVGNLYVDPNGFPVTNWAYSPSTHEISNKKYKASSKEWLAYSMSEQVPYIAEVTFDRRNPISKYVILANSKDMSEDTKGLLIRSQKTGSYGNDVVRVYNGNYELSDRGSMTNFSIYSFYTDKKITYDELENYLLDSNIVFSFLNRGMYIGNLGNDGVRDGNLELFIQGGIGDISSTIKIEPVNEEIGKKTFLFMFLK